MRGGAIVHFAPGQLEKMPHGMLEVVSDDVKSSCQPRHDKTNKMSVRPAKTQISLGIRPV